MTVFSSAMYTLKILILFLPKTTEEFFDGEKSRGDFTLALNKKIFEVGCIGRQ